MSQTSAVPRFETCALQGCPIEVDVDEGTGRVHDYCSRTHSIMARALGNRSRNDGLGGEVCKMEGCIALVYRDPETGEVSTFWVQQRRESKRERLMFAPGRAKKLQQRCFVAFCACGRQTGRWWWWWWRWWW